MKSFSGTDCRLSRRRTPKVRTGCFTCKIRRVKCDEEKPHCRRCVKASYDCEGYSLPKHTRAVAGAATVPIKPRQLSVITYNPDVKVSTSLEERRFFHMFCQNTAAILAGYFPSEFWSRLVPQTGHSSEPIRHAVTALAALIHTLENTSRSPLRIDVQKQTEGHYLFALSQYNKAISTLRYLLSTDGSTLRTTLTACLLFACIETLQGDVTGASQHIVGGFGLVAEAHQNESLRLSSLITKPRRASGPIDGELISMFTSLEVQSRFTLFFPIQPKHQQCPSVLSSLPQFRLPHIPSFFSTVPAAKVSLDAIMISILRSNCEGGATLQNTNTTSAEYRNILDRWEAAFLPHIRHARAAINSSVLLGRWRYNATFTVASNHAMAIIIVATNGGRCSEMLYDTLTAQFQYIVDCSEVVINAMVSPKPENTISCPKYIFDAGLLPPLHIAASKCRIPSLRRMAIVLLEKYPVQEGIWEGYGRAKVCRWIMEIEENMNENAALENEPGNGNLSIPWRLESNEVIPEWNRVRLSAMDSKLHQRKIWAQCKSLLPIKHGSHRIWERTFTW